MTGFGKRVTYGTLLDLAGVYVIRFPEHVKVGHSLNTWPRFYEHVRNGALDATVFEVAPDRRTSFPSRPLRELEREAIAALGRVGVPLPQRAESFAGIEYSDAARIVRNLRGHHREVIFPDLPMIRGGRVGALA